MKRDTKFNHTKKDFQGWHKLKERLDKTEGRVFFHEREVWWCSLGVLVWFCRSRTEAEAVYKIILANQVLMSRV